MALICCENLTLAYEGAVVVEDLGFEVNAGIISALWAKTVRVSLRF